MTHEVDGYGPQTWKIALNLGYWDTRSWTKPLLIWHPPSVSCKLNEALSRLVSMVDGRTDQSKLRLIGLSPRDGTERFIPIIPKPIRPLGWMPDDTGGSGHAGIMTFFFFFI